MTCNVCGKAEASIHLTEIVNDKMVEVHLCQHCAQEKGGEFNPQFSFGDLLAGLTDFTPMLLEQSEKVAKCSSCGQSVADFGKSGRLGCPDCYRTLGKLLIPVIKRVQRSMQHVGKKPQRLEPKVKRQLLLREMEEKLRKYIEEENYEQAALIRDEIRKFSEEKVRVDEKDTAA